MTHTLPPRWAARLSSLAALARGRDLRWLFGLLLIVASVWVFVELADEVGEGELQTLDERIILAMRVPGDPADPIGPEWFEEAVRDVTALGGTAVVALVTLAVAGFLVIRRRWSALWLVLAATFGAALLSLTLKEVFDRPRPDLVAHGAEVMTASFPSGHSMVSAAVYLTLGALLARLTGPAPVKLYLLGVACGFTGLIGLSRVYLGVHYPSDVLAGWAGGLAWAGLCGTVAWWLQRRGKLRGEGASTPDEDADGHAE